MAMAPVRVAQSSPITIGLWKLPILPSVATKAPALEVLLWPTHTFRSTYGGPPIIFILNNTIIANNGANECFFRGTMNIGGIRNLIMNNGSGSGQFSACPGVVATSDPQLLPLELNSPGNAPTMAIFPSSPAFNSADPRTSLSTDQRGVPRPQLGGFDIGAFEARGDGR